MTRRYAFLRRARYQTSSEPANQISPLLAVRAFNTIYLFELSTNNKSRTVVLCPNASSLIEMSSPFDCEIHVEKRTQTRNQSSRMIELNYTGTGERVIFVHVEVNLQLRSVHFVGSRSHFA